MTGFDYGSLIDSATVRQEPQPEQPKARSIYDDLLDGAGQQADDIFLRSYNAALKANPDLAAEAQSIGKELGIEPQMAERDIASARRIMQERAGRVLKLARGDSMLARMLSDPQFARIAHDQTKELGFIEDLTTQFEVGKLQTEQGNLYDKVRRRVATPDEMARLGQVDAQLNELPATASGAISGAFKTAGQWWSSASEVLGWTIAGGLTGAGIAAVAGNTGPQVLLPEEALTVPTGFLAGARAGMVSGIAATTMRVEAGSSFQQLTQMGVPADRASAIAGTVGFLNGLLEAAGGDVLAAPWRRMLAQDVTKRIAEGLVRPSMTRAAGKAALEWGKGVSAEVLTEVLQESVGMLGEATAGKAPTWAQVGDRLKAIAEETVKGTALLALPGPAFSAVRDIQRARVAEQQARWYESMQQGVDASKLTTRAPDAMAEYVQQTANGKPVENVYIEPERIREALAQGDINGEQLARQMPDLAEKLAQAERDGADVVFPIGQWAAKVSKTDLGMALKPHLRFDPDMPTFAEAQQVAKNQKQYIDEAQKLIGEMGRERDEFEKSAKKVEDGIRAQLDATKKYTAEQAAGVAKFYRAFAVTQADRLKITPEEFAKKYALTVEAAQGGERRGEALSQVKTDTPEFKAWFGDSKVVDANGKPVVVFRGGRDASAPRSVESTDEHASTREVPLHFFSTDRGTAERYAADRGGDVSEQFISVQKPVDLRTKKGRSLVANLKLDPSFVTEGADASYYMERAAVVQKLLRSDVPAWQATSGDAHMRGWQVISAQLRSMGYDGLVMDDAADTSGTTWATFSAVQGKSVDNSGAFNPNDPNIYHKGDRGDFAPADLSINLYEQANISTVLHEFSHYFLTVYERMAEQGDAFAQKDMQALIDWFGVKDLAAWQAMSFEERRKHHEAFAYSFETWLFDGKAPSKEVEGVFKRVAQWMRAAYKGIRDTINATYKQEHGIDLPILTDEVRAVFDRMLASEEQVRQAEAVRGMAPLFESFEQSGMSQEQWQKYQEALADAREAAVTDATRASLRQMQWLTGARSRVLKKLQAEHKKARAEVRERAEQEVLASPVERTRFWLKNGKHRGEQGDKAANHKLRTSEVQAVVTGGQDTEALVKFMSEDGVPIDAVAEGMGYENGADMVRDLLSAPATKDAIEARTDEMMLAEHGAIDEDAISEALHNEARARFVAVELRALTKATQPTRVMVAAARAAAVRSMDSKTLREIRPERFEAAERRAAANAKKASKAGDTATAIEMQQRVLLAGQMVRVAREAKKEVAKAVKDFEKLRRPDDKLAKTRNVDMVNGARYLLSAFGIYSSKKLPRELLEPIRTYDAEMFGIIEDAVGALVGENTLRDYRDLTLDQFRLLRDTAESLWFRAKRDKQMRVAGELVALDDAAKELAGQIRATQKIPDVQPGTAEPITDKEQAALSRAGLRGLLTRVEHLAYKWDGGKVGGAVAKLLYRNVQDGAVAFRKAQAAVYKELLALFKSVDLGGPKIPAPELGYTFPTKADLLSAMLHAGNESNKHKDHLGRKWAERLPDGTVDDSKWDGFVRNLLSEGRLTKADIDFLNGAWKLLDTLKEPAQKTHHALYGTYFDEIKPLPMQTRHGVLTGGYVPAAIDYDLAGLAPPEVRQGLQGLLDAAGQARQLVAGTGKGFTKARTGVREPLVHDLRMLGKHVDQVLRFIHLQPAIMDTVKLLGHQEVAGTINAVDRRVMRSVLMPWLERTAWQQMSAAGVNPTLDSIFRFMRRSAGAAIMFGNVVNAAIQATGFSNTAAYVKPAFQRAGLARWWRQKGVGDWIASQSEFMAQKFQDQMGEVRDGMAKALDPSKLGDVSRWFGRNTYFAQAAIQNQVDAVTWLGAYEQSLAESKATATDAEAHRKAVADADSVVRLAQGAQTPESVARYEALTPFVRMFTQFSGYQNNVLNTIASQDGAAARTKATFYAFILPTIVNSALATMLYGKRDDDDEQELASLAMDFVVAPLGKGVVSAVPGFGPAINSLVSGPRPGDRLTLAPAISSFQSGYRGLWAAVDGTPFTARDTRDLLTFLSMASGIPVAGFYRPLEMAARAVQ